MNAQDKQLQIPMSYSLTNDNLDDLSSLEEDDNLNMIGDYLLGQVIGRGSQGEVYKALHINSGKFVAVKEIISKDKNTIKQIEEEIKIISHIKHPNIIQYNDVLKKNGNIYLILEFIESGSLKDVIKRFGQFPEPLAAVYVKQILQGLNYLHKNNIYHRDIKGGNILITKDGICKLADFGLARNNNDESAGPAGTTYWMAPELFDPDIGTITTAIDIWSLGATIVEIITGSPPFQNLGPLAAIYQIAEGETSPIPIGISKDLHSFLSKCFIRDPKERLTAEDLLEHKWITGETIDPKTIKQSAKFSTLITALREYRESGEGKNLSVKTRKGVIKRVTTYRKSESKNRRNIQSIFNEDDCESNIIISDEKIQELLTSISKKPTNIISLCKDLAFQVEGIIQNKNQAEEELRLANKETEHLSLQCSYVSDARDHYKRGNIYLKEKIEYLEENLYLSDLELAKILYGNSINWSTLPQGTKRGYLRVTRSKLWKKRRIGLLDNFLFIFKCDTEEPCIVMKLLNVTITTGHRKLPANTFCLNSSGKQLLCNAANFQIMAQWMQAISFAKPWYDEVPDILPEKQPILQSTAKKRLPVNPILKAKTKILKYSTGQT